jgi:hypothetical protein
MGKRGPQARKGAPTTIRFEPTLRAALEVAAVKSGRTLSEEVAQRLRLTLEGGDESLETRGLLLALKATIDRVENLSGEHWHADPFTCRELVPAFEHLLSAADPDPNVVAAQLPPSFPTSVPDGMPDLKRKVAKQYAAQGVGKVCAEQTLELIAREPPAGINAGVFASAFPAEYASTLHDLFNRKPKQAAFRYAESLGDEGDLDVLPTADERAADDEAAAASAAREKKQ